MGFNRGILRVVLCLNFHLLVARSIPTVKIGSTLPKPQDLTALTAHHSNRGVSTESPVFNHNGTSSIGQPLPDSESQPQQLTIKVKGQIQTPNRVQKQSPSHRLAATSEPNSAIKSFASISEPQSERHDVLSKATSEEETPLQPLPQQSFQKYISLPFRLQTSQQQTLPKISPSSFVQQASSTTVDLVPRQSALQDQISDMDAKRLKHRLAFLKDVNILPDPKQKLRSWKSSRKQMGLDVSSLTNIISADSTRQSLSMSLGPSLADLGESLSSITRFNPGDMTMVDSALPPGIIFGSGVPNVPLNGRVNPTNGFIDTAETAPSEARLPFSVHLSDVLPQSMETVGLGFGGDSDTGQVPGSNIAESTTSVINTERFVEQAPQWIWPDGFNTGPLSIPFI